MRILTLLLLYGLSMFAQANNCDRRYERAERSHDALIAQEQGTKQFFADLDKLEDLMFESIQKCEGDARIVALMAEIQITARQGPLAHLYAKKALEINPDIWQSQHAMGSVLTLTQQYEQALVHLKRASRLAPQRTGLKLSLCRTQALAGNYAGAIKTCTDVIHSDDNTVHGLAYYLRSLAYNGLHETERAQADINKARKLGAIQ